MVSDGHSQRMAELGVGVAQEGHGRMVEGIRSGQMIGHGPLVGTAWRVPHLAGWGMVRRGRGMSVMGVARGLMAFRSGVARSGPCA